MLYLNSGQLPEFLIAKINKNIFKKGVDTLINICYYLEVAFLKLEKYIV